MWSVPKNITKKKTKFTTINFAVLQPQYSSRHWVTQEKKPKKNPSQEHTHLLLMLCIETKCKSYKRLIKAQRQSSLKHVSSRSVLSKLPKPAETSRYRSVLALSLCCIIIRPISRQTKSKNHCSCLRISLLIYFEVQ